MWHFSLAGVACILTAAFAADHTVVANIDGTQYYIPHGTNPVISFGSKDNSRYMRDGGLVVVGNNEVIKEMRPLSAFSAILTLDIVDVDLRIGDKYEVEVEGDSNLLPFVMVMNANGMLSVHMRKEMTYFTRSPLKATVRVPADSFVLRSVMAYGVSKVVSIFSVKVVSNLKLFSNQNAKIIGDFDCERVLAEATGKSCICLSGQSNLLDCHISDEASVDAENFECKVADVIMNGSSKDSTFNVTDKLTIMLSGLEGLGGINMIHDPKELEILGYGSQVKKD